jgi:hypothetical protein
MTALSFGYNRGLPEGTEIAWGARWIYPSDQLPDRTSWLGEPGETGDLMEWLNGGALSAAHNEATRLALSGELTQGADKEVTLYEDERGKILANPNASHGYLYVCAYLTQADGQAELAKMLDIYRTS